MPKHPISLGFSATPLCNRPPLISARTSQLGAKGVPKRAEKWKAAGANPTAIHVVTSPPNEM
jgi:hypothetical protein